jgi:hypothetical protein
MLQEQAQHGDATDLRRLARVSGALYLALALLGLGSPMLLEQLVVPNDAAATATAIRDSQWLFAASLVGWVAIVCVDTALAVTFYVLLRRVGRTLALVTAAGRIVYAAMLAALLPHLYEAYRLIVEVPAAQERALADIEAFQTGFLLAIALFGVHVLLLGYLLYRSGLVPRALGAVVVVAGGAYIVDSFGTLLTTSYGGALRAALVVVILIGELGLVGWLLLKGVGRSGQRP